MKTQRLEDITGDARTKLERSYLRAHRRFFAEHIKQHGHVSGDELVRFRQMFLKKKNITSGV